MNAQAQHLERQRNTKNTVQLLPTRKQLETFLQSKGINPSRLGQMSTWEQIQLTREYQQIVGGETGGIKFN